MTRYVAKYMWLMVALILSVTATRRRECARGGDRAGGLESCGQAVEVERMRRRMMR